MKFTVIGSNVTITESMKEKIEKKFSMLEKYFLIDENTNARVNVQIIGENLKVEVTIPTNVSLLRAEVKHFDFYSAVDIAIDKLEDQIRKLKTKLSRKHKQGLSQFFQDDNSDLDQICKRKSLIISEMDEDEAIIQMELLGHDFFIFKNIETNKISVLYLRKENGYGLIEIS